MESQVWALLYIGVGLIISGLSVWVAGEDLLKDDTKYVALDYLWSSIFFVLLWPIIIFLVLLAYFLDFVEPRIEKNISAETREKIENKFMVVAGLSLWVFIVVLVIIHTIELYKG